MNELGFVWVLVSSKIEKFKVDVFDYIERFYKKFDNSKSLSRQPILDLISDLNFGLDSILLEMNKYESC